MGLGAEDMVRIAVGATEGTGGKVSGGARCQATVFKYRFRGAAVLGTNFLSVLFGVHMLPICRYGVAPVGTDSTEPPAGRLRAIPVWPRGSCSRSHPEANSLGHYQHSPLASTTARAIDPTSCYDGEG